MLPVENWLAEAGKHLLHTGRPLVTLSFAQSLDGSIALPGSTLPTGRTPLVLSGPETMILTHRLRAAHDAILVGIGTLLADDPQLTVRLVEGRQPRPVVLDSHLRFPLHARLLNHPRSPWIGTLETENTDKRTALEARGVTILTVPKDGQGQVDLNSLLERLGDLGVASLMVEGGAGVISSFLRNGLVDQVVLTISPLFLGGLHSLSDLPGYNPINEQTPLPSSGKNAMSLYPRLKHWDFQRLGDDLIVWGKLGTESVVTKSVGTIFAPHKPAHKP
jgi:3,4-dihydroxy 2-butanone 4-phosphate synthase/GTP cyclohydrolase II